VSIFFRKFMTMTSAKPSPQFVLWSDRWEFNNGRYKLSAIHQVATFTNAAGFQRATDQFSTSKVPLGCSLHVFKQGVPPVYDHPKNCSGGHFKLQAVQPQSANELWGLLTEFFINGQMPHPNHINGITYMKKQHARGLKVWLSKSLDNRLVTDVKKFIQSHLPPQQFINFKFCPHKYILQTLMRQNGEGVDSERPPSAKGRGRNRPRASDEAQSLSSFAGGDVDLLGEEFAIMTFSSEPAGVPHFDVRDDSSCLYEEEGDEAENDFNEPAPVPAFPVAVNPWACMAPVAVSPSLTPYSPEWMVMGPPDAGRPPHPDENQQDPRLYGSIVSPLGRLREKFSQRYADRPLPMTPVAYMSELLLLGPQADVE